MKKTTAFNKTNTTPAVSIIETDIENLFSCKTPELSELENFFQKYYEQHKRDYDSFSTKAPDIMPAMINSNDLTRNELSRWGNPHLKSAFFFRDDYNISIVPHMRYSPVFLHSHDFYEITYSFSGHCRYYIDNSSFVLEQDQLVLIAPGKAHAVISYNQDSRVVNFLIKENYFRHLFLTLLPETALTNDILHSLLNSRSSLGYMTFDNTKDNIPRRVLVELINIYFSSALHASFLSELKIQEFFVRLSEFQSLYISGGASEPLPKLKAPVTAIIRCIRNDYRFKSKKEIAAEFGYSERQLTRIIKNYSGKTYSALISQFRTEDACRLLESTDLPIYEIAEKLGFSNTGSFYQSFSQSMESTPNQFRKKHTKENS